MDSVKANLKKRNINGAIIGEVIEFNQKRKNLINFVEQKRAEIKSTSKEIGGIKKSGGDAASLMEKVAAIKKQVEASDKLLTEIEKQLNLQLSSIPNLVSEDTPKGDSDEDNIEVKKWGDLPLFNFEPKEHFELGENLDYLDFERGARLTGSRFVVYKGQLARLERALINYFIDAHLDHGYEEIIPPFIVNADTMYGTGQLPKFEEDLFKIDDERGWYLIPTAEVPLTNLKRGELFKENELPLKYVAYTPCFRSEAGSYGKDTKGLIRLHQFNKVELVNIVAPEKSDEAHEEMVSRACSLLEELKLPYRMMQLCGGDIGFSARKCYDLEVWLPGQERYREISSVSNCWNFQARRASIRFRNKDNKPTFAHTLNGSGLAVGRTLVAILENYQREDGSIDIPEVLWPYMGGMKLISKK